MKQKIEYEKEQAFKCLPETVKVPKLTCKKTKGHYQYYVNAKYVSKIEGLKRIRELALVEYHEALLPLLEKQIGNLKITLNTEERLAEAYARTYEGKRILFEPDIISMGDIIKKFKKETYEGLAFDENDHTEYFTNRGERVRSKSEKIIADELDRRDVLLLHESAHQPLNTRIISDYIGEFLL